jgi:hypothetical protein
VKRKTQITLELEWDDEAGEEDGLNEPRDWFWDEILQWPEVIGIESVKVVSQHEVNVTVSISG